MNAIDTDVFPLSSGKIMGVAKKALKAVAPAPSVTIFSSSVKCKIALEIQLSSTKTFK